MPPIDTAAVQSFISRWESSRAAERATSQQFFLELCALLRAPQPNPGVDSDYTFERPVQLIHADGKVTTGFIDVYHRGHFVWESKQGSETGDKKVGTARRGTAGWDKAMRAAFVQARRYANELPEGRPPFVLTCDVGYCIEVWTGFSGNYGGYGARERRILLADLLKLEVQDTLHRILTDPQSLNPTLRAAKITGEVAGRLAVLARTLEGGGHNPESVARFLMRAIFTMFAEDVGLLPDNLFTRTLQENWIPAPWSFPEEVTALWAAMNEGMRFGFKKLLHFNGGLFSGLTVEDALPLTSDQLQLLLEASHCDWGQVEPAIFGTLVERALSPEERHRLGAHFTPRAYIERVVRPTVIEPLQADWEVVQAEVRQTLEASIERRRQAEARRLKRELTPEEVAIITPTPDAREKAAALISSFHNALCHGQKLSGGGLEPWSPKSQQPHPLRARDHSREDHGLPQVGGSVKNPAHRAQPFAAAHPHPAPLSDSVSAVPGGVHGPRRPQLLPAGPALRRLHPLHRRPRRGGALLGPPCSGGGGARHPR